MSCLQVIAPGFFTTVQDLGRPGHAHLGVSASGAADPFSFRLGNLLLGNPENAASLEMTVTGGTFRFPEGATFALAGGGFEGELNRARVASWTTVVASAGAQLSIGPAHNGARGYLCVRGGIRVPPFLGSASTHFLSGKGGVAGRALQQGDLLRIGRQPSASPKTVLRHQPPVDRFLLRATPGVQSDRFSPETLQRFYSSEYMVSDRANRMGVRLEGPELRMIDETGILSQGVSNGSVQVTSSGQPLILFVEQQTTGGYPLIASVISVDLPKIGQLSPGERIRFQPVAVPEAVALLRRQEQWIAAGDMFE